MIRSVLISSNKIKSHVYARVKIVYSTQFKTTTSLNFLTFLTLHVIVILKSLNQTCCHSTVF